MATFEPGTIAAELVFICEPLPEQGYPGPGDPTPEQIRQRCAEIQATWSNMERLHREGGVLDDELYVDVDNSLRKGVTAPETENWPPRRNIRSRRRPSR